MFARGFLASPGFPLGGLQIHASIRCTQQAHRWVPSHRAGEPTLVSLGVRETPTVEQPSESDI